LREGFLLFAAAMVLCVIGYAAANRARRLVSDASTKTWSDLRASYFRRGVGGLEDG
jgi:hypothetical protein